MYNYKVICHHGIKGQQWGKRNGPPYPLDESDKSTKEKSEQKKTDWKKVGKIAGVTALAVGATALTVYGGYKLSRSSKFIQAGKEIVTDIKGFDTESEGALKVTSKEIEDIAHKVNPEKGKHNCVACASAICANISGQNVTAKGDIFGEEGFPLDEVVECFGRKLEDPFTGTGHIQSDKNAYDHLIETLKKRGEGSYGIVSTARQLKDENNKPLLNEKGKFVYSGHEVMWRIIDGNVHLFEGQKDIYNKVTDSSISREYADWYRDQFRGKALEKCLIADLTNAKIDPNKGRKFFNFS